MPKPIRGAENAEIGCRIGAKSGADFRRNHLPISTEIRCRFAPIFAPERPWTFAIPALFQANSALVEATRLLGARATQCGTITVGRNHVDFCEVRGARTRTVIDLLVDLRERCGRAKFEEFRDLCRRECDLEVDFCERPARNSRYTWRKRFRTKFVSQNSTRPFAKVHIAFCFIGHG